MIAVKGNLMKVLGTYLPRLLLPFAVSIPLLWANSALGGSASWNNSILVGAALSVVDETVWQLLPRLSSVLWRAIAFLLLGFVTLFLDSSIAQVRTSANNVFLVDLFLFTLMILFGLSLTYRQPKAMFKLAGISFGIF